MSGRKARSAIGEAGRPSGRTDWDSCLRLDLDRDPESGDAPTEANPDEHDRTILGRIRLTEFSLKGLADWFTRPW